ncbi:HTH-type transcriptional regulator KdgR [Lentilactobacillus fungorum]|uniref:HTH-type transcriptional regulator KdgR n=1 Tax=Lentilactobacillus fungorum TaxID=2201250 RepID=A0ABQ3VZF5_9LACO|nr:LacI family DNA-binding transcriptional regulator [Lentilactobacillus fungorum]GHP13591.1 HTH-type transcriptional regulator KdgR [Lentilactobacillus fungorum]
MKNVTISDVAKAAGVSVTTVSRYLNGNFNKMSAETQAKITTVIKQLNYHPSASARRLRTNQSKTIGVIVGDISNVFSSLLFSGIYEILQPHDYSVLLLNANNSATEERKGLNRLLEQEVDGFIIQPSQSSFNDYQFVLKNQVPLVTVDREPSGHPQPISQVVTNNLDASRQFGAELIAAGYNQILLVSSTTVAISAQAPRIKGFKEIAAESSVRVVNLDLADQPTNWLDQQIQNYRQTPSKKTVIVSLMGPLLFKTLAALRHLKLHFPDQIGLASFDDWDWSKFVGDGIDLMQQDPREIGRQAAKILLTAIETAKATPPTTKLIPATRINGHSF